MDSMEEYLQLSEMLHMIMLEKKYTSEPTAWTDATDMQVSIIYNYWHVQKENTFISIKGL